MDESVAVWELFVLNLHLSNLYVFGQDDFLQFMILLFCKAGFKHLCLRAVCEVKLNPREEAVNFLCSVPDFFDPYVY